MTNQITNPQKRKTTTRNSKSLIRGKQDRNSFLKLKLAENVNIREEKALEQDLVLLLLHNKPIGVQVQQSRFKSADKPFTCEHESSQYD